MLQSKLRYILVLGFFIMCSAIAFRQYIFGGLVPIQFNLLPTIYSPWRNEIWKGYERGVPNKPIGTDNPKLFYPYRKFTTEEFKKGNIPMWNPYVFSGNVHAATYQAAVWYPFNILYFLLSQADAWSMLVLLQPILVGWFTYLFLRSQGISGRGSLFGAATFAFSGWMISWWEESIVIVHSILWLPLALFASTLIWEQKRKISGWVLLIIALSMSLLAGFLQMSIYLFTAVSAWNLFCWYLHKRQNQSLRQLVWIGLAFVATLFITAIQWLPALEAYGLSPRGTVKATFLFDQYLVPLEHFVTLLAPDFWGNPGSYNYFFPRLFYHEKVIWIGLFPLIFALLGVGLWRDRKIRFWIIFSAIVLSLGFAFPTSWIWHILNIPVLSAAQPARIFVLFAFGASILASYGMDAWLVGLIPKKRVVMLLTIVSMMQAMLWGITLISRWHLSRDATLSGETIELYGRLATISFRNMALPTFFTGIAWIAMTLRVRLSICYVVILVATLTWSLYQADKFLYFSDRRFEFPETEPIKKLKELTTDNLARVWGYGDASITPNMMSYYGLYSSEGYDALFSRDYGELLHTIKTGGVVSDQIDRTDVILKGMTERDPMDQSPLRLRFMSLLGVRYILEYKNAEQQQALTQEKRFPPALFTIVWEDNAWRIWEYKKALPRAWFAGSLRVEKDPQRIVDFILNEQIDLTQEAIVGEMPDGVSSHTGPTRTNVVIRGYFPTRIELEVVSSDSGMVVISDTYFPGWVARVDGELTKIYRTNYALRGIPVSGGKHSIQLTYEPISFRISVAGTVSGIGLSVVVVLFLLRQNPRRSTAT